MDKGFAAVLVFACVVSVVRPQQMCYYGAGAQYRAPSQVVPCNGTGASACCLLGDTCLSGNTCYNHATGNLYQYGCTDINYEDSTCPYKCGFDPNRSPWIALQYCSDIADLTNTWICHGPESCGCEWEATYDLLVLQPRGCKAMGSDAYVALSAPSKLAPYVSLPSSIGGSTGYYSPTISDGTSSWVETAIAGYTPAQFTQLTTYRAAPTTPVQIDPDASPGPSTYAPAGSYTPPASIGTSTTATESTSSSSGGESSTTSPSASVSAAPGASSGLSTGEKIGIGVGGAGVACLIAVIAIALWLLRRRSNKKKQTTVQHATPYPPNPPMHGNNWAAYTQPRSTSDPYSVYQQEPSPYTPYSEMSRHKSQRAPSYETASPDRPPFPSPPMELATEMARQVHEIDSSGGILRPTPRISTKSTTPSTPTYMHDHRI